VTAALGAPLQPGSPIMTVTSTTRVVTVHVDVTRIAALRIGDAVAITVSGGGAPLTGHVTDIGAPVSPSEGGAAQAPVRIGLDSPDAAGIPDGAPVQVTITTARRSNVMVVPIDALLAAPGGGYEVVLVDDGGRHPTRVTTGLFDETGGLVEVAGAGIVTGALVEVPAP
jgi:multidrug efflux pump subunit AcrA (membrane-fusion protein)